MNPVGPLWSRLTYLLRWRRFDDDLQQEIAFHVQARADELERSGMNRAEALAVARRAFGSGLRMREQSRDPWRFRWLDDALLDLRYALRMLRRTPVFTLTALGTLAVGIGSNTAIFSVVDAALLRPLPYPDSDRLVEVHVQRLERARRVRVSPSGSEVEANSRILSLGPSLEDVRDWQADRHVFSDVGMWDNEDRMILDGRQPERVTVLSVSEGYLGVLGLPPALGRGISSDDVRDGAPAVVLISYGFWQSHFGGEHSVIGRVIRLDNEPATIVGVLPATYDSEWSQIWRPIRVPAKFFAFRGTGSVVYARLRPGLDIVQAERTMSALTSQLDRARGRPVAATVRLRSLYDRTVANYRRTAELLAAAVALILLIACANVAGLLLARGAARRPELAVRASIGAGRARLARQLLTESAVLAAAGGVAGLLLARVSLDALVANIPISVPSNSPVTLNARVLAFAAIVSMVTSVAFGCLPAVRMSDVKPGVPLTHATASRGSALSRRGGQMLIGLEVALAVVLVSGAGLMIRSFSRLLAVDVGFDPASIVTMDVVPVSLDRVTREQYYTALVRSLRSLPSVEAVGATDGLPLAGGMTMTMCTVDGESRPLQFHQFLPGYFEAIGVPLKDGRFPTEADRTGAPPAAVVNEPAAAELFRGAKAVGRVFTVGDTTFRVVGVVGSVRHWGPFDPVAPETFLSFGYRDARPLDIVVRPRPGTRAAIGEQLRKAAQSLGTRVVVDRIRTGTDLYGRLVLTPRRRTVLLGLFGGVGLLLALVGVFGVTAYAVARRTREIGVRMALGAGPGAVVRAAIRDSLWPAAIGIVAGLGASLAATRVIASLLFETRPTDPRTLAGVAVVLALATFLAALIPARRAARVDPVTVLRAE